jgi:hypothetical protein
MGSRKEPPVAIENTPEPSGKTAAGPARAIAGVSTWSAAGCRFSHDFGSCLFVSAREKILKPSSGFVAACRQGAFFGGMTVTTKSADFRISPKRAIKQQRFDIPGFFGTGLPGAAQGRSHPRYSRNAG